MFASQVTAMFSSNSTLSTRCLHLRPSRRFTQFFVTRLGLSPAACYKGVTIQEFQQKRGQSSQSANKQGPTPPSTPPSTLLLHALKQSVNFRPLFTAFRSQSLRSLFRQSPEELVLAIILLCGAAGICVYVVYAYFNYFQSKQFTRFPPPIARSLRRALYYSNYSPDPNQALKYYKLALQQCSEAGLDIFSDEVMGIRIQLAAWFEKIGSYKNSIDVLESLLHDCKRWIETMEQSARDGLIDASGSLKAVLKAQDSAAEEGREPEKPAKPENMWAKRMRILGKSIAISAKLGELYADEHVLESDLAGDRLVWSVETVLKELQRRRIEGVREGEGDWMTPEQVGGALEALGNHYESKSQHYLAAPLFLQAITLAPPSSCHTAVLMNNLAISLAQQPVDMLPEPRQPPPADKPNAATHPTRSALLASARSWATQAQATAQKVRGEDRTEECDEACAVALCNLGIIAEMSGDVEEAKRRFKESLLISKNIPFEPGVIQAEEGLQRLSTTSTGPS
ncbi:hypothetical protein GGS23DRAFT_586931 [Durotheca rogersii]|uniref:uncharacterized protein n=1 Tax=Durotheca rogersii TaxID=419775 RepID=UPI00221FC1DE|nr:uncharacterized protein GGS23DRAFT_586931 [Durotheca rogersii]KAI5858178.1 hypothetical protein GGS23DRAFT_586931 [Durotheca rogersii]